MEASCVTFAGGRADEFADEFVAAKAEGVKRSINKRGVRNIHTYEGDGVTQVAYERGSAYESSWLQVSLLFELQDDERCRVVTFVGGGGRGPFKLEEVTVRRLTKGEDSMGEAGRFATVLRDVKRVADSLDLRVETEWESETEEDLLWALERKIFDS